jgi:hypothetical protein
VTLSWRSSIDARTTKVDGVQPPEPVNGPVAQPSPAVPGQAVPPTVGAAGVPPGPLPGALPGAPPPALARRPRNRRARLWIALGAGILALLCLGGVGVFISVYDEATEIKRSAPDAVVDSFLGAYLVNRDDQDAALYTCESSADLAPLTAYRATMTGIEKDKSVGIRVSWSSLVVAGSGSTRTVTTDLTQTATDGARLEQTWSFGLVDQDGWRVCSAAPVA